MGSLFSGVGGFEQGMEAAGFEVTWQVEIDKDAISVLERHYPHVPPWRDVTDVDPAELPPVDVVAFGSPCQDMSVAGKRGGLDGERSGLFYEAVRIIGGLRPAPAFCVWENVVGALSSAGGRDFGAILDALADIGALDIGWRVLDARYFGVAQRRRRVFLVADFGGRRGDQILFEPPSGSGDSAARSEAGQRLAGAAEDGTGVAGTVRSHPRPGSNSLSGIVGVPDVAFTLPATAGRNTAGDRLGNAWNTTYVPLSGDGSDNLIVAALLTAGGHPDSSAPGQHREDDENLVAVAFTNRGASVEDGHETLRAASHGALPMVAVAIPENQRAAPWDERNITSRANQTRVEYGALANTLHSEGLSIVTPMAVRRLTPRECERLMGWPDDWTRYRTDGSEIPDGPRYRMIGNGVVAPVARWIGRRLLDALPAGGGVAEAGRWGI